jgi:hypothetical protein
MVTNFNHSLSATPCVFKENSAMFSFKLRVEASFNCFYDYVDERSMYDLDARFCRHALRQYMLHSEYLARYRDDGIRFRSTGVQVLCLKAVRGDNLPWTLLKPEPRIILEPKIMLGAGQFFKITPKLSDPYIEPGLALL